MHFVGRSRIMERAIGFVMVALVVSSHRPAAAQG